MDALLQRVVEVQPEHDSTADADTTSSSFDPLMQDGGVALVRDVEVGVADDFVGHILRNNSCGLCGAGQAADQQCSKGQGTNLHLSFSDGGDVSKGKRRDAEKTDTSVRLSPKGHN